MSGAIISPAATRAIIATVTLLLMGGAMVTLAVLAFMGVSFNA